MTSTENSQPGLYWTPKGGNNHETMFASCHKYTSVTKDKESGQINKTIILIDMGQNEYPKDFAGGRYDKVVPALTDCLAIPGQEAPKDPAAAIFLTHSHSDHVDAIFEYVQLGVKLPPIYGTEYTINALKSEFIKRHIPVPADLKMNFVEAGQTIEIGNIKIETLEASHSVPGCLSFKLSNEEVSSFHSGDTKSDPTSSLGKGVSLDAYRAISGVDFAVWDAAMAGLSGHSISEDSARQEYQQIFEENRDKQMVVALPAAHSQRLASVVAAAAAAGKHVIVDGGSTMETNFLALGMNGYDLKKMFPNIKVASAGSKDAKGIELEDCITITTAIYGEENSPFVKKLQGTDDSFVLRDDAVVISPIVGKAIDKHEKIEDYLSEYIEKDPARSGIKIITARDRAIGSSGHAQCDDLFDELLPALNAKVNVPTHTATAEKAKKFMRDLEANGYGTLSEYPRNGYTIQIGKQGCQIISREDVQWIGAKYSKTKDKDGNDVLDKMLRWKIVGDHGFSTGRKAIARMLNSIKKRHYNAQRQIKEWREKKEQRSEQRKTSGILQKGINRNDRE